MPIRVIVTDGTTADCTKAEELIDGIKARYLLADKGYDSDEIVRLARKRKMVVVILKVLKVRNCIRRDIRDNNEVL